MRGVGHAISVWPAGSATAMNTFYGLMVSNKRVVFDVVKDE